MQVPHIPVLVDEVLEIFDGLDEGLFVDCTLGFGGHSKAILQKHSNLRLLACDQDEVALDFSMNILAHFKNRCKLVKSNFKDILSFCKNDDVRGILADIGLSSLQLDDDERGFSLNSTRLDMRMDKQNELSAFEVVNFYPQERLECIFKENAELTNSKFIAQKICEFRAKKPISSAKELSQIIGRAKVGQRSVSQATLVFQALRIEVNQELSVLKEFLEKLVLFKPKNCIVAIICFHSLEDVLVKNAFKKWSRDCICDKNAIKCECGKNHSLGKILTKKPIVPSLEEIKSNSRSSCAKMRVFYFK
ncbi:16S rRNA (cytosine(1402)-N(4))-methyltransferase RsmH [Campylobacter sp. MIT 99-7217]|uniref:16S rRNA (cytosine(1402)-N(4))-methyltransferase RsmH n=1 Tax=Campylobacter sp. MIT 99-7217 TaxID=535091 RepID=UPI00115865D6|nr:16S rRNA (cytosine(1402)-N(4))-methyltransferase RsmH [Campylobacter sp. MIT 99-7217]TQR31833.1 16S rRNA (cytosine(1402)-N(4))-methyltransferase RsmH [Campylobacter sp. MIT 99-7217]